MTSTPEQVIAKIREALEGDHERLCQGREYTCTCGHDDAVQQALTAALQSAADTPAPQTHVVAMDAEDRTPLPDGYDAALWQKADEVHHAMALVASDTECVKILYAALVVEGQL